MRMARSSSPARWMPRAAIVATVAAALAVLPSAPAAAAASFTEPASDFTSTGQVVLQGTKSAGSAVELSRAGAGVVCTITASSATTWQCPTISVPNGEQTFTGVETLADDSVEALDPLVLRFLRPPALDGSGGQVTTTGRFTGQAEPGASIQLQSNGAGAPQQHSCPDAVGSGFWSCVVILPDGEHEVRARQSLPSLGPEYSTYSPATTATIDRTPPAAPLITSPRNGDAVSGPAVTVEGEVLGHVAGLRFTVDPSARQEDRRMLLAAAEKALPRLLGEKAVALAKSDFGEVELARGAIRWRGQELAKLEHRDGSVTPLLVPSRAVAALPDAARATLLAALEGWLAQKLSPLEPLEKLHHAASNPEAGSQARALLLNLIAGHGYVTREQAGIEHLPKEMRPFLRKIGVTFGALDIFDPALLKPAPRQLLHALGLDRRPVQDAMLPVIPDTKKLPSGYRHAGSQAIRIDLVDDADFSMFSLGTTVLTTDARDLLDLVAEAIAPEGGKITVRGHTDALKYRDPTRVNNWSLSAGRAETTRQDLIRHGIARERFRRIEGVADTEPLIAGDPTDPRNRRISISLEN